MEEPRQRIAIVEPTLGWRSGRIRQRSTEGGCAWRCPRITRGRKRLNKVVDVIITKRGIQLPSLARE